MSTKPAAWDLCPAVGEAYVHTAGVAATSPGALHSTVFWSTQWCHDSLLRLHIPESPNDGMCHSPIRLHDVSGF